MPVERQAALKKICDEHRARIGVAMMSLSQVEGTIPQMPEKHLPEGAKDLVFSHLTNIDQEEINRRRLSKNTVSSSNSDNNNNNNNDDQYTQFSTSVYPAEACVKSVYYLKLRETICCIVTGIRTKQPNLLRMGLEKYEFIS